MDHFNQNGNIKSISHIDADINADVNVESVDNVQKSIQSVAGTVNDKASLGKTDIELAVCESKPIEKKDVIFVKEKSDEGEDIEESRFYLFRFPMHKRIWQQLIWIIIWPMEGNLDKFLPPLLMVTVNTCILSNMLLQFYSSNLF